MASFAATTQIAGRSGGGGLRHARSTVLSRRSCARPDANSSGPTPGNCRSSSSLPTCSGDLAYAQHLDRTARPPSRKWHCRRKTTRAQIHRHHRPLETRHHGRRPRCQATASAMGRNRSTPQTSSLAEGIQVLKGVEVDILERGGLDLARRRPWPRPIGSSPACITVISSRVSRSQAVSLRHWRIRYVLPPSAIRPAACCSFASPTRSTWKP